MLHASRMRAGCDALRHGPLSSETLPLRSIRQLIELLEQTRETSAKETGGTSRRTFLSILKKRATIRQGGVECQGRIAKAVQATLRAGEVQRRIDQMVWEGGFALQHNKSSRILLAIRSRSSWRRTLRRRSVPSLSIQVTPPITIRVSAV